MIENIAFEGGGIRAIAYGGAIKALEQIIELPKIKNVAGASAGSIAAFLIAIGLNGDEICNILKTTKFQEFNDTSFGFIRNIIRILTRYGYYRGDAFSKWVRDILISKDLSPDITFSQLSEYPSAKKLYVVATNLTIGESEVFSSENTPNMKIVDALRMSMSIPFYYSVVKYNNDIYVDGGVLNNFPVQLFDNYSFSSDCEQIEDRLVNHHTLGLRLDSDVLTKAKTNNLFQYAKSIFSLVFSFAQTSRLDNHDWSRTILIYVNDIGMLDFDITEEEKQRIIDIGYKTVKAYYMKKGLCSQ